MQTGAGPVSYHGSVTPVLIPEPSSLSFLAIAVAGMGVLRMRRQRGGRDGRWGRARHSAVRPPSQGGEKPARARCRASARRGCLRIADSASRRNFFIIEANAEGVGAPSRGPWP